MAEGPPQPYETPELLDRAIDVKHRSFMSAVRGLPQHTFRARVPLSTMPLDDRWLPRYVCMVNIVTI